MVNFLDERCGDAYDAARWARVDALIAAAHTRQLGVILDLSTFRYQRLGCGQDPYLLDWKPFVTFVAGRYASTPGLIIALAGEPSAPNSSDPARPTSSALSAFYARTATEWHLLDPARVVTSGGLLQLGWNSGIDWRTIFATLGYCSVHIYSQSDIDVLPTIAAGCVGLPLLIEEFGLPQSAGDSSRAAYYSAMYARARSAGAGVAFWNVGPQVGGVTYDVNAGTPLTWAAVVANAP